MNCLKSWCLIPSEDRQFNLIFCWFSPYIYCSHPCYQKLLAEDLWIFFHVKWYYTSWCVVFSAGLTVKAYLYWRQPYNRSPLSRGLIFYYKVCPLEAVSYSWSECSACETLLYIGEISHIYWWDISYIGEISHIDILQLCDIICFASRDIIYPSS